MHNTLLKNFFCSEGILKCIGKCAYYISTILDHKTIHTVLPQDKYGFTLPMGQNRIFRYFQNLVFFF